MSAFVTEGKSSQLLLLTPSDVCLCLCMCRLMVMAGCTLPRPLGISQAMVGHKRPRIFDSSDSDSDGASAAGAARQPASNDGQVTQPKTTAGDRPASMCVPAETLVAGTCGVGISTSSALEFEAPPWPAFVRESLAPRLENLGPQLRDILVITAFSGLASIMQALKDLQISARELVAAEPKVWAHKFCRRNNLLAEHVFLDVRSLVATGSGTCIMHGHCKMQAERADLVVMGFPCRPYSGARTGSHIPENVMEHDDFQYGREAVRFILKTRPRAGLLENVIKFSQDHGGTSKSSDHEITNFCEDLCADLRASNFHVRWMRLDLNPWVRANSARIYIFFVDGDVGLESTVSEATKLAQFIQDRRRQHAPVTLRSYCLSPSCQQWIRESARLLENGESQAQGVAEGAWTKQASVLREKQGWQGDPWTQPPPGVVRPQLRGCSKTNRSKEITNLGFFWGAKNVGLDPSNAANRSLITKDLICDPTQNPCRNPWGTNLRRMTRVSRPYIYEKDRSMFPLEGYRAYGWQNPCLEGLTDDEAWDLLGDSMALQTLGVAVSALLCSLGERLPGVWRGQRAS